MAALQRVLKGAPTYAELVTGHPPGAAEAQSLFTALPPGITCDSKYLYGFMTDVPELVGCADLIRGWPTHSTALIGLLLLDEEHQGQGIGESAYQEVEAKVRHWPEIDVLRVAVVRADAAVLPFWQQVGFTETGEVRPYVYEELVSESIILGKRLRDSARVT